MAVKRATFAQRFWKIRVASAGTDLLLSRIYSESSPASAARGDIQALGQPTVKINSNQPPASAARGGNKVSLRAAKVIFANLTSHQIQRAHRHFQG